MKAYEIMEELFKMEQESDYSDTCDTCKAGDPMVEVSRVAVCMFATPDVIKQVKEWGAQLLIVHEPTYYNHMDIHSDERIETEKRRIISESGLTIYRYHDHSHYTKPDIIATGMLKQFGLEGEIKYTADNHARIHLDSPITPVELARIIEKHCNIKHLRICGARNAMCSTIIGMFGTPDGVFEEIKSEESEIVLTGEACEWSVGEYVRDASQLGYKKALIIMGHVGSERDGMRYTADLLKKLIPELDIKYFECGEVYTYTDSEDTPEFANFKENV